MQQPFDNRKELFALVKLGVPMMVTQFFIMAMGSLDAAMAGHYSSEDLAGVALGGNILWPAFMLFSGVLMAVTPMSAQLVGEKRTSNIGELARQAMWLALFSSVFVVVMVLNAEPVLVAFNVEPSAAAVSIAYLDAAAWGMPAVMCYITLRYVCEGIGHTIEPMFIVGSALVVNGVLNYIFIYGKLGLPAMGGEGCGWATAITMWFEFFLIVALLFKPWLRETGLLDQFDWIHWGRITSILKVGIPIGVTVFLEMAVFSIASFFVGSLGVTALAAHSIAGNINWATYVIPLALGSAISIRIGFYVGARNFDYARKLAWLSFKLALGYALFASTFLIAMRYFLTAIYTSDLAVVEAAASLLIIVAIYQLVDCTQVTLIGALRGYKDTTVPAIYSFVGYWILALPVGWLLCYGYLGEPLGVHGFWIGFAIALGVVACLAGRRLFQTSRDEEKILRFSHI